MTMLSVGRQPSPEQRALSGASTGAKVITLPSCGAAYSYDPARGTLRVDGVEQERRKGR